MGIGRTVAVAFAALALTAGITPAVAVAPPEVVVGPAPADDPPGPDAPTKQDKACVAAGALPDSDLTRTPPPELALDLAHARSLSRGAGVTVALIDTGVSPHSRLPDLLGGGDYVAAGGNGLSDCDAHGTLIAGIIGAASDPADGFTGVAPEARIVSIRYRSGAYSNERSISDPTEQLSAEIRTLARAITHAANEGADVIAVPIPVCVPVGLAVDQSMVSAAVGYAVHVRGALIVAGAGGTGFHGCEQNPDIDPARPDDPRNWRDVKTLSVPGWFSPEVLAVGFTTTAGAEVPESLTGPWVSVAAPGVGIESLGPGGGGLINGVGEPGRLVPVGGASFAAAYVTGVAALLRSRFPNETPAEISARLTSSAHAPARRIDNRVGAGVIDPVAALAYRTPPQQPAGLFRPGVLAMPLPQRPEDVRPRVVATLVIAVSVLLGLTVGYAYPGSRRRR